MIKQLKIDFVSDVTCPWCAVGLGGLEQALTAVSEEIHADVHFQPFELNPQMGEDGQDAGEHLTQKYGSTEAQQAQVRLNLCERGNEVGFEFNPDGRGRIWNTFDAHRLLYFAGEEGSVEQQSLLKKALLAACHTHSARMNDPAVLHDCASQAGLDAVRVEQILSSTEFAQAVRDRQAFYHAQGVHSVPAIIINDRHLISGGQPTEVFVQALRQVAEEGG